jgi:hypothetical protein
MVFNKCILMLSMKKKLYLNAFFYYQLIPVIFQSEVLILI